MFASRLKRLREKTDISQKELAKHLGITDRNIRFYESGERTPPADILIKIADYFNVSTDYILGKTYKKNTKDPILKENEEYYDLENVNFNVEYMKDLSNKNKKRIIEYIKMIKLLEENNLDIEE